MLLRKTTMNLPVECEMSLRIGDMLVDTIRLDTGEVVGTRPANHEEIRQLEERAKAAKDAIKVETATLLRLSRECNDGIEMRSVRMPLGERRNRKNDVEEVG